MAGVWKSERLHDGDRRRAFARHGMSTSVSVLPSTGWLDSGWLAPGDAAELDPASRARGRRLALLMLAIVLMSVVDLLCTIIYMRTSGMVEMNPLARLMIAVGDLQQLVFFKLGTMVVCCGSLYLARRHARAEGAAWICTSVLLLLTVHWINYNQHVSGFTNDLAVLALSEGECEPRWIKLD